MDPYLFSLALGGAGLGVMAATGLSHGLGGHDASHAAGHGHAGHAGHAHAHGHAQHGDGQHGHGDAHDSGITRFAWSLLSPRVVFSVLVGGGLTGLLLRPLGVGGGVSALVALAGGLLFEALLVAPLWRLLFRFGSRPALTLESCVADRVEAVTGFDAEGHGLVAVPLDGQIVQILATLTPDDRAAGIRVRAGDRVRIETVDAARNRCTVSTR
jgi:hypothetical protein